MIMMAVLMQKYLRFLGKEEKRLGIKDCVDSKVEILISWWVWVGKKGGAKGLRPQWVSFAA